MCTCPRARHAIKWHLGRVRIRSRACSELRADAGPCASGQVCIRQEIIGKRAASNQPGPGAYESPRTISPAGKYFCSNFRDSGSNALRSSAQRFEPGYMSVPGPGQYDNRSTINPEGRNFVSRFQSSLSRTFGSSSRACSLGGNKGTEFDMTSWVETPGPGSYGSPSEFGIYDAVLSYRHNRANNKLCGSSRVLKDAGRASVGRTSPETKAKVKPEEAKK